MIDALTDFARVVVNGAVTVAMWGLIGTLLFAGIGILIVERIDR